MLKHAILGLLASEPRHGYEIKKAFEEMMGHTWTLNIGQVYSTLARLERDGLVEHEEVPQELLPNRKVYHLTEAGRAYLADWLRSPSAPSIRLRADFYLKLLVARRAGQGDPCSIIWRQRESLLKAMSGITPLLTQGDEEQRLLAEGLQLHLEADLKWLDRCEDAFCGDDSG